MSGLAEIIRAPPEFKSCRITQHYQIDKNTGDGSLYPHIDKDKSIELLMSAIPKVIKETNHQIAKSFEKVEKVYEKVIKENQK
jgi:hypothetical protein